MLEVIPNGFEVRRRRGAEFALSLRVAGQYLSSFGHTVLCARFPLVGTAMSIAGGLAANMSGNMCMTFAKCTGPLPSHYTASSSCTIEFNGKCCSCQYERGGAPFGFGSLSVRPRWSDIPGKNDFDQVLCFIDKFACQRRSEINNRFVIYFDTTEMVWPSVRILPQIIASFREQPPSVFLRNHTVGIAILHQDSQLLRMIITYLSEIVVVLLQPAIMPVFATSCEAADHLLIDQLSRKPAHFSTIGVLATA